MDKKCWIHSLLALCLGIGFGFSACGNDKESEEWTRPIELNDIDSYIREGIMMKAFSKEGSGYSFSFENQQTIQIPESQILDVVYDKEKWMTTLILTNNREYLIPTWGTSIDGFIKGINLNPSGYNPLAASIQVEVPSKGRFRVRVYSKDGALMPDQAHLHSFSEATKQDVVVLGLYAGYENQVELTYTDKNGNARGATTIEIQTQPLQIKRLPENHIIVQKTDRMEPGMTLIACPGEGDSDTSIPYMIDSDGEIRWLLDWSKHPDLNHLGGHSGLHRMKNGNYITGDANKPQIVEVNYLGEIVNKWNTEDFGFNYHHELCEAPDGHILIAVTKDGIKTSDGKNVRILDHIAELNPKSGGITQLWDLTQILDSSRITFSTRPDGYEATTKVQSASNWCHNNGVTGMRDGSILCSCRWQGLVKFSPDGKLKWVISPHNNWREEYKPYLLTPLDKSGKSITDPDVLNGTKSHPDFDWGWGIHCPEELPNGNVMAFDNGYSRLYNFTSGEKYSRVVEWKVDEKAMTVQQVWEYGRERGSDCFSSQTSGSQYLKQTGNRLFCPGIGNKLKSGGYGGHIVEIDGKTGEVVFEVEVKTSATPAFHRANRMSLYSEN